MLLALSAMTLTLQLPPELEALLRQRAERSGQDVDSMAIALLTFGLSFDDKDFSEALEGIQKGLDNFEQGQFFSFDEFVAEQERKRGISLRA